MTRAPIMKKKNQDKLSMRMKVTKFLRIQRANISYAWGRIKNPIISNRDQVVPIDEPIPELSRHQLGALHECCARLVRMVEKDKKNRK